MPGTKRRYSKKEIKRRGEEIFKKSIRDSLGDADIGRYLAIEIETGRFEVDDDERTAYMRMRSHTPDAQIWMKRIGFDYLRKIGGGPWREK